MCRPSLVLYSGGFRFLFITGVCVLTRLVITTEDLYNNKVSCALHIVNIHTMGKVFSALIVPGQETALLNIILSELSHVVTCCTLILLVYCSYELCTELSHAARAVCQDMLGRLQYWCGAYYCYVFRECNIYLLVC